MPQPYDGGNRAASSWPRQLRVVADAAGTTTIEYILTAKKSRGPDDLLAAIGNGGIDLYESELR
ncbi:MAG: hypothetical protein ABI442_06345 [Gemmatimonadaceae bacterium]